MDPGTRAVYRDLIEKAYAAARQSYSPRSRFPVGSALLCQDGTIVTGCNVENVNIGMGVCAERNAVCKAVSEGKREFKAIAVASPNAKDCWPCGTCRQVVAEFAPDLDVVVDGANGEVACLSLSSLLPQLA